MHGASKYQLLGRHVTSTERARYDMAVLGYGRSVAIWLDHLRWPEMIWLYSDMSDMARSSEMAHITGIQ